VTETKIIKMDIDNYNCLENIFTPKQWEQFSEYERNNFRTQFENYVVCKNSGMLMRWKIGYSYGVSKGNCQCPLISNFEYK